MYSFDIGIKQEVEIMKRALFQHKDDPRYVLSVDLDDMDIQNALYKSEIFYRVFGDEYQKALFLCNYETYDILDIEEVYEILETENE